VSVASRWAVLWPLALAAVAGTGGAGQAKARAIIQPSCEIELASPAGGIIQTILVEEGDRVRKGQAVVELDSRVPRAALAISEHRAKSTARIEAAEANVRAKRVAFERKRKLRDKGVASDAEVEEVELEFQHAESLLTVAREEQVLHRLEVARDRAALERLTVRAPMDAVVVRRLRDEGEAASEFEPLLELVVLDTLHVIAHVPHDIAARLKPGDRAQLVLDDAPDRRHDCRVLAIDPVIDAASGTRRTRLELPNPRLQVVAGARASVFFQPTDRDKRRAEDAR